MYKALAIITVFTTTPLYLPSSFHSLFTNAPSSLRGQNAMKHNLLPPLKIMSMWLVQFIMKFHALIA